MTNLALFVFVLQVNEGIPGVAAAASSGSAAAGDTLYSTAAADTEDIYRVPTSNTPVDPSKTTRGRALPGNTNTPPPVTIF